MKANLIMDMQHAVICQLPGYNAVISKEIRDVLAEKVFPFQAEVINVNEC